MTYIQSITIRACPSCNSEDTVLKGRTPDDRQIFKCKACGKKTTENKRVRGSRVFNLSELLPLHLKLHTNLNNGELYSLGVLIADGSISKTGQMSITLQERDQDILTTIRKCLCIDNQVRSVDCYYSYKGKKITKSYKRLTWANRYSTKFWEYFGLINGKTGNEQWLPYMNNTHFVRGFLDGDGGMCISRGYIRLYFSCPCLNFIGKLRLYINELIKNMGSMTFSKGCYNLQYHGEHALNLASILYKGSEGIRSDRKYEIYYDYLIGNYK
jgi:hypothetical protein